MWIPSSYFDEKRNDTHICWMYYVSWWIMKLWTEWISNLTLYDSNFRHSVMPLSPFPYKHIRRVGAGTGKAFAYAVVYGMFVSYQSKAFLCFIVPIKMVSTCAHVTRDGMHAHTHPCAGRKGKRMFVCTSSFDFDNQNGLFSTSALEV